MVSTTVPDVPVPSSTPASAGSGHPAGAVLAWCGLFLLLLARGYRAFLLTLVVAAMIPSMWSWSSYVVKSGSMEPGLSVGDVVVGKPHSSVEPVPVGRIMIFDNPDTSQGHDVLVHRVMERLADGTLITQGDANPTTDSSPVPAENFRSRAVICVPFIGLPLIWASSRELAPLAGWLVFTMLALYFSTRPPCDPRHRRRQERNRARRAAAAGAAVLQRWAVPLTAAGAATVVAVVGVPMSSADAAFSATTTNPSSGWTVSAALADSLVLTAPADVVRGTVALSAALRPIGGLTYSVRIEYAPAGTTGWNTICTKATAPYGCDWATTAVTNQDYDLRAVATSGTATYASKIVEDVTVDNAAPTVTMQNPGSPLLGTTTFAATAADADSGVDRVVIQYAATGSSTYKDLCTIQDEPFSCRFDTTTIPGGSYSLRAVATDVAGNTTTSAAVTNRIVDNAQPSVSLEDPGAFLTGTVTLNATASSRAGITSVRVQRAPTGTSTWTDVCADSVAPYACGWNTTSVSDGLYDLRAVMLDGAGRTTTSATVSSRRVDNSPLRAVDVQTTNGGNAGNIDAKDTISFTYSGQAKLTTISSGWDGTPLAVTLRFRDGGLLGTGSKGDTVDVLRGGSAVNLGSVNLHEDFLKRPETAQFAGTMTASSTTVGGVSATRVTIIVGAQTSGKKLRTVSAASTMVWAPSTLVTNLAGRAVAGTPASESGPADREF